MRYGTGSAGERYNDGGCYQPMTKTYIGDKLKDFLANIEGDKISNKDILCKKLDSFFESFYGSFEDSCMRELHKKTDEIEEFKKENIKRYQKGFDVLDMHIDTCIYCGCEFQKQILEQDKYSEDVYIGMLMRIHARACRVALETTTLMKSGYADAALSRWRSLYELGLAALAIKELGRNAAQDYFISGLVKSYEGMEEYQKCAGQMGFRSYTQEEMETAKNNLENTLNQFKKEKGDYIGEFGWLRCYIKSGKRDKVEEFLNLKKWSHDYKWASQDIHAGYRDPQSLLGMSQAKQPGLLVGPSDSGMTDPAHRTAICLNWVTSAFLNAYADCDDDPFDTFSRVILLKTLGRLCKKVGDAFLEQESNIEKC